MVNIKPAIISDNFTEIKDKISQVEELVPWVHLDVMDGLFVPPVVWPKPDDLNEVGGKIKIETHLMVTRPEEILVDWMPVTDRLIVHFEATDYVSEIIETLKDSHTELALAFLLDTPVEDILLWADKVAVIQLMSISKVGYHGQPFSEAVLEKIKILHEKFPNVIIQIDGGLNLKTGQAVLDAGASDLVVGSALWQAKDLNQTIKKFQNLK